MNTTDRAVELVKKYTPHQLSIMVAELECRISDEQRDEIITVLQAIYGGFSDDPAHDAGTLLAKMTGEIAGFGQSFTINSTHER